MALVIIPPLSLYDTTPAGMQQASPVAAIVSIRCTRGTCFSFPKDHLCVLCTKGHMRDGTREAVVKHS